MLWELIRAPQHVSWKNMKTFYYLELYDTPSEHNENHVNHYIEWQSVPKMFS